MGRVDIETMKHLLYVTRDPDPFLAEANQYPVQIVEDIRSGKEFKEVPCYSADASKPLKSGWGFLGGIHQSATGTKSFLPPRCHLARRFYSLVAVQRGFASATFP